MHVYKLLSRPFSEHLLFMLFLFVFATSPYFLYYVNSNHYYYAVIIANHGFVLSYIVTLLISFINYRVVRKFVEAALVFFFTAFFCLNFYSLYKLGGLIDVDYLMLIVNTNPNEAREFVASMLPGWVVSAVAGIVGAFVALWWWSRHHNLNLGRKGSRVATFLCLLCMVQFVNSWGVWVDGPIKHIADLATVTKDYEMPENLEDYQAKPEIVFADGVKNVPTNVVLIIGESFARYHSSLYGYDKETNPCLSALKSKSMLYTMDSVDAPAPTTSLSLKYMLSECYKEDKSEKKWYEYATIIQMMHGCGYDCLWLSNQARAGKFNYIARFFAESCDRYWFLQNEGTMGKNTEMDSVLVDSTALFINDISDNQHHFIVYHMMGSHFEHSLRYPERFARFTANDYMNRPEHQREVLATYDNSILYNDYIVAKIMEFYENTESLVIYVPDHGQDMFCSAPDYHEHGKMGNPVSYAYGVKIPFMIYASQKFQKKHPETIKRIKQRQENPMSWNGDDLPYLIMDLIGVKTVNGKEVALKSILPPER